MIEVVTVVPLKRADDEEKEETKVKNFERMELQDPVLPPLPPANGHVKFVGFACLGFLLICCVIGVVLVKKYREHQKPYKV